MYFVQLFTWIILRILGIDQGRKLANDTKSIIDKTYTTPSMNISESHK